MDHHYTEETAQVEPGNHNVVLVDLLPHHYFVAELVLHGLTKDGVVVAEHMRITGDADGTAVWQEPLSAFGAHIALKDTDLILVTKDSPVHWFVRSYVDQYGAAGHG